MTNSRSSKKSTEPSHPFSTIPSCVGTFLLENWNACVAWSAVETSCSQPVPIDSDLAPSSHCSWFPLLCQDELADGYSGQLPARS